jgi:hypothetical protein
MLLEEIIENPTKQNAELVIFKAGVHIVTSGFKMVKYTLPGPL